MSRDRFAVLAIIFAEFAGTSLWFTGTASLDGIAYRNDLGPLARGILLCAVQIGFILGTMSIAISGLADRFRPSRIFAVSAVVGAAANIAFVRTEDPSLAILFRGLTGVALAGIYPIGMKLILSWRAGRAGNALSMLVAALTLGTAFPALSRAMGQASDAFMDGDRASLLALVGGVLISIVGDGPALRSSSRLSWNAVREAFRRPAFRTAAFAYFGHMWELYAFWAAVPLILTSLPDLADDRIWWVTFVVIGSGSVGCLIGGRVSSSKGSRWVARTALTTSALCCLLAPGLPFVPLVVALALTILWGMAVVADSPHFSALSSQAVPPQWIGSALAIQNAIGFAITLVSIPLCYALREAWGLWIFWVLAIGPLVGVWILRNGADARASSLQ